MLAVNGAVFDVVKKVRDKYGSIQCQEIQFNHWGKAYRLSDPGALMEFAKFASSEKAGNKCGELAGDAARWAVDKILEVNPGFLKRNA